MVRADYPLFAGQFLKALIDISFTLAPQWHVSQIPSMSQSKGSLHHISKASLTAAFRSKNISTDHLTVMWIILKCTKAIPLKIQIIALSMEEVYLHEKVHVHLYDGVPCGNGPPNA